MYNAMISYLSYYVMCLIIISNVHCEELPPMQIEDKCNFIDSKLQPNTFRLLSKTMAPPLDGKSKGDAGKIGVIGGSTEYTGAPYFAAITALKVCTFIIRAITIFYCCL